MKTFTFTEALKEIAYLFPFQPFGNTANIRKMEYNSPDNKHTFNVELFGGDKYLIDLDGQTFKVID